jgi:diguanylate cyclase (GGDEF)-like protein
MDPRTVIVILAIHLIAHWAAGAMLFGVAYLGRLVPLQPAPAVVALLLDAALLVAALLFVSGLRQFVGRPSGRAPLLAGLLLGFAALHGVAVWQWGPVGRHMLLDLGLGLIFGVLAAEAMRSRPQQPAALSPPLIALSLVTGTLAALTLARGLSIAWLGSESLYRGLFAQLYHGYASLAVVMLGLILMWLVFVRLNTQLMELASRDALTRLLNRNGLDEVVRRHFAARESRPVTLLQVDIDHFKRINDSLGHAAGDHVLREVAASLSANVRASDFIARVGGEEFLVGCVAADDGVVKALAERLLAGVRKLDIRLPGLKPVVQCTVSIGISHRCPDLDAWERCWAEADRALYAAKAAGRDRVLAASALRADLR